MYLTIYKQVEANIDYNNILQSEAPTTYYKTTLKIKTPTQRHKLNAKQLQHICDVEKALDLAYITLKPFEENTAQYYYTFQIPKRTGGLRTINAPTDNFKNALTKTKEIFEQYIKCLPHDSAYAYTKHRSVQDALIKHQANQSNWFLKIDLTDFFPSCTPTFIFQQLMQIYPFYYLDKPTQQKLQKIIQICCLNNGLPQGTPMSPLLTNLVMAPYDYQIYTYLKRGTGNHFVYTRYADDILISSKSSFNWQELQSSISTVLFPFIIKKEKTRYGSKAGSNWNLGLMLNKDNQITLGYQKKKQLNAMLHNFLNDFKNNNRWTIQDTQVLQGQLSYLNQIEPDYAKYIIDKYEQKFKLNYHNCVKAILNPI